MIKVHQNKTFIVDGVSDWRQACFASLLERTLSGVLPLFTITSSIPADNPAALAAQGYKVVHTSMADPTPQGYAILTGITMDIYPEGHPKAGQNMTHGYIVYNGEVVHDPYPTGKGLIDFNGYDQIVPLTA